MLTIELSHKEMCVLCINKEICVLCIIQLSAWTPMITILHPLVITT